MSDVTKILSQIQEGDPTAAEKLLPLVYQELRNLAAHRLRKERTGHTLQATALVHEAYIRLIKPDELRHWDSRGHFFAAAAEAMRRILVDSARRKRRLKRDVTLERRDLTLLHEATSASPEDLLSVDEALSELSTQHPEKAELVKLRFFAGLTVPEAAEAMGVSLSTADRYWSYARAWLFRQLHYGELDRQNRKIAEKPRGDRASDDALNS